jgi:hypothetical protein
MSQRISAMPPEAIPVARGNTAYSSMEKGLGGMIPPNEGMRNQDDGGMASKPYVNSQEQRQQLLAVQNMQQNGISAIQQANANGGRQAQLGLLNTPEEQAKQFATQAKATVLEATDGGRATMKLNAMMQSPERENVLNSVAVSRAMGEKKAPELGQVMEEANRYIG